MYLCADSFRYPKVLWKIVIKRSEFSIFCDKFENFFYFPHARAVSSVNKGVTQSTVIYFN